jgi:hypothetical protein
LGRTSTPIPGVACRTFPKVDLCRKNPIIPVHFDCNGIS